MPVAPHLFEQDVTGEHLARLTGECHQQIELQRGQRDRHAVTGDLVRRYVDLDRTDREQFGRLLVGTTQPGTHACHQFLGLERFDHVVVGTGFQTEDDVDGVGLRGEHHDGHTGVRTQHATDVDAVHPGQHQVEQHQVRADLAHRGECLRTVADDEGFEPLTLQHDREHLGERGIIIDDEDPWLHAPNGDTSVTAAW